MRTTIRPPSNALERLGGGRDAGEAPHVVPVLREPGHKVGSRHRAERDHEVVAVEPAVGCLRAPLRGVDRLDLRLEELDAVPREQRPRPAAVGDGSVTDELPQLAQPHGELRLAVDEHDLVVVAQGPPQLHGRRDAAEAAAEDERAGAHAPPCTRATTSSSVGANLSTNCCTRPIRSLNSGCPFQPRTASMPSHPKTLT